MEDAAEPLRGPLYKGSQRLLWGEQQTSNRNDLGPTLTHFGRFKPDLCRALLQPGRFLRACARSLSYSTMKTPLNTITALPIQVQRSGACPNTAEPSTAAPRI